MDTLATLKAERGIAADKLTVLAEADEAAFDIKAVESATAIVTKLDQRIGAIELARSTQARLAKPAGGQPNGDPIAAAALAALGKVYPTARRVYGGLKYYKTPDLIETGYRVGQFIKATIWGDHDAQVWCQENEVPLIKANAKGDPIIVSAKAQAEGVNSAGGVLVPEEMMNSIIVLRETYGIFRRECRVVPMARDTLNWPRRTGGLTAYFVGENQGLTESQVAFDNVNLTAKKLATLTKLSTEIAEDAVVNIADFVVNEISYAFASKEDDCGFNGDGTSTYGGMRGLTYLAVDGNHNAGKYTAASGHNTFALLDATDITGLMGLLPQYALPNAKFYISQLGFATTFERLIAAAGGNRIDTLDGSIVYRYLGFPIVISQKLPLIGTTLTTKAMMFFGDLTLAAAMGERRGVTIRRLDERFADNDQIGIMGTERFDINVHDMGNNTTAGPIVSLVAP